MSAIVAFGSITASVTPISGAGTGDLVIISTTLNQPVELTIGGANCNLRTVAILGVSANLPAIPAKVPDGAAIGIRHFGSAPTSGSIAVSVIKS